MDKKLTIILVSAVLWFLGGAAAIRWVQTLPYPKRSSGYVDSPNQRHRAFVSRVTENRFFTGIKNYYRFKVEIGYGDGSRVMIHDEEISPLDVSNKIDMNNLEDVVTWSKDSYSVNFFIGRRNIKVAVPL
jgi:hypothetical protein